MGDQAQKWRPELPAYPDAEKTAKARAEEVKALAQAAATGTAHARSGAEALAGTAVGVLATLAAAFEDPERAKARALKRWREEAESTATSQARVEWLKEHPAEAAKLREAAERARPGVGNALWRSFNAEKIEEAKSLDVEAWRASRARASAAVEEAESEAKSSAKAGPKGP